MTSLPSRAPLLARPIPLGLMLALVTAIPILAAVERIVQVPLDALPPEAHRLSVAPAALFTHALSGVVFGLLGPVQFVRGLRSRFGAAHRLMGRLFVLAGLALGLSGVSLLLTVQPGSTPVIDIARAVAGVALIAALVLGVRAAMARKIVHHRAWMIRAYAIGMGSGTVALIFFPIYVITGDAPTGLIADVIFTLWWGATIALAEGVIRRLETRT